MLISCGNFYYYQSNACFTQIVILVEMIITHPLYVKDHGLNPILKFLKNKKYSHKNRINA